MKTILKLTLISLVVCSITLFSYYKLTRPTVQDVKKKLETMGYKEPYLIMENKYAMVFEAENPKGITVWVSFKKK
jgi:hypothetical protein